MRLWLPVVRQLSTRVLWVMEASARRLPGSCVDHLFGLTISPYVIAAAMVVGAVGVAAIDARDLPLWLVVVAGAAGWSSAWSP